MTDLLYEGDLLTSGHHATCTVALCGLSFYATVKGKQTYSMLHLKGWFIDKTSQISGHTWGAVEVDGSTEPSDYCANFPWLFFAGGEKLSEFSLKEMCASMSIQYSYLVLKPYLKY